MIQRVVTAALVLCLVGCGGGTEEEMGSSMTVHETNEALGIDKGPDTIVFSDVVITGDSRDQLWTFQGLAQNGLEYVNVDVNTGPEGGLRARDYNCDPNPYSVVVRFEHLDVVYTLGECVLTVHDVAASSGETMSISLTGKASPYLNDYVTISAHVIGTRM